MVYDFLNGNIHEATKKQLESIELIDSLFCEVNPIPVKAGLNMIGFNAGTPRLPLVEMSENGKNKLNTQLLNLGLIK